jgi:hypothetical protein
LPYHVLFAFSLFLSLRAILFGLLFCLALRKNCIPFFEQPLSFSAIIGRGFFRCFDCNLFLARRFEIRQFLFKIVDKTL